MSTLGNTFSRRESENREGTRNKTRDKKKEIDIKEGRKKEYSPELRSRFGEAFLPFATNLESVESERTKRKRKGRNKRLQPKEITNLPTYKELDDKRKNDYMKSVERNIIKLKIKKINMKNKELKKEKLKWQGDIMTLDDGWPDIDKRKTLRLFHINLNDITYQNKLLEWEMTIAHLMDMQVDIFGFTEVNLDLNNGIVRDNVVQAGKHFDPYLRMATSSSLQKVGESPFKMGGTITGTNGCWSGRITSQGSDSLGRRTHLSLQARHGNIITFITVYLPKKTIKAWRRNNYIPTNASRFTQEKRNTSRP